MRDSVCRHNGLVYKMIEHDERKVSREESPMIESKKLVSYDAIGKGEKIVFIAENPLPR
ncbi:conserved hypothetical protein [Vibrio crassostreae]|nr:conserved hypothetical protein [Vibrio crassostreae]CAK1829605.1 conserved hypothetical protein [Vibrio crassostreae]CAK1835229.1 conserved hypothetical protein [Vibrio crassostreae]CAK1836718.1 conserved hypothetical protein [Vibrio crassostreae]CAK2422169.1 conserved hypothetical protein [Vibrio crassostreae]